MIVSTIIMTICFVVITFELFSALVVFRSCRKVRCRTVSSVKVCEREDGYLIKEFWNTEVAFELDGVDHTAELEPSTFCQKGQTIGAYYYPKKDLVFRKRDVKRVLRSYSIPAFSVGMLFLLLNLLFRLTALGSIIIAHVFEAIGIILIVPFLLLGLSYTVSAVTAFRHTRGGRVTSVKAKIADVIRKSKRHRETVRYQYFPVYRYTLGGFEHNITSRIAREAPPKKDSTEKILVDKKKGGLVEYKDIGSSFILGLCFLGIAAMLVYVVLLLK